MLPGITLMLLFSTASLTGFGQPTRLATASATASARSGTATVVPQKLTLAQAEQLLVERNLAVLAAKYQIDASRAARLVASYKPNPVLTIGGEQIPFYSPAKGGYPRFFKTNADAGANPVYTLRVDKIVERGGKRELRTAVAEEQLKATEAQLLDAVRTQLFQLHQAFTAATLARENLLLAEATEKQYVQTEVLTEAKVEAGDLPGVEIYRARAGRLQFQQAVLQAHTAYEQATRDVLNLLGARVEDIEAKQDVARTSDDGQIVLASLGSKPESEAQSSALLRGASLEIVASFDDRPLAQSLEELRQMALSERPDVAAARHLFEAANRGIALAQAQRVRDISVGTEYQTAGQDQTLGASLSVPLFLYNNQRAAIAQAEAQRKASEALLRQAELQATTDVEKAYQSYLSARRMLDLYGTQNLKQIEKLRSIATLSYREGASSLFELLDAQRTYNAAQTSFNQARADYQLALWQLEQAVGRPLR